MDTTRTIPTRGTTVDAERIETLRAALRRPLVVPGDADYDGARAVWNGMIDRRPAVIVRSAGVADVMAAVNFAREHDLLLSIRGGGHNVAGNAVCEDGLMLDLSRMKGIRIDPLTRTATVEAGVLWGELDHEAQAFGLATTGGTISTTGVAGLTLGGGVGWLNGKHGLSSDNLLSADVVLADGSLVHASDDENPDLFWAIRGAGANFGVVTSFEFRLHPVGPTIYGGMILHPIERTAEMLRFYRDFSAAEPDEMTTYAAIVTTPDGMTVGALVTACFAPPDEAERLVAPLRMFGSPLADLCGPIPYVQMQSLLDAGFPAGRHSYWKSAFASSLSDEAIDIFVKEAQAKPSPYSVALIEHYHGAYARRAADATAFRHRADAYDFVAISTWDNPEDTNLNIAWTRGFFQEMEPHLSDDVYVNVLTNDERAERVRAAYGGNYDRLAALKRMYDPNNLFRMNHNIEPAS